MDIKLPFGLKNGEIVDISKVESGLNCNCFCPNCNSRLIARKGIKTVHHFAHYKSPECKFAFETAIHLMSKKIFEKHKRIKVPKVNVSLGENSFKSYLLFEENYIEYDSVIIEKKIESIIPDIILIKNGKKLLVEIAVTHFVDDLKNKKIKNFKISTLEINLNKKERDLNEENLTEILIDRTEEKKWVFNTKWNFLSEKVKKFSRHYRMSSRAFTLHIDNCPIKSRIWNNKIYANFYDDCQDCHYFFGEAGFGINCLGNYKNEVNDILKLYAKKGFR